MHAAASALAVALLVLALGGSAEATPRAETRRLVNRERADVGCDPIAASRYALRKARAHSREMAAAGELFHSDLAGETGWTRIGEVIGVDDRWASIVRALFASPEHRRVLLDCRYAVGAFGFVFAGGTVWLTGRLYAR